MQPHTKAASHSIEFFIHLSVSVFHRQHKNKKKMYENIQIVHYSTSIANRREAFDRVIEKPQKCHSFRISVFQTLNMLYR